MNHERIRSLLLVTQGQKLALSELLSRAKDLLVFAHRHGEVELSKELSQVREALKKKRHGHCEVCGTTIDKRKQWCGLHGRLLRRGWGEKKLASGEIPKPTKPFANGTIRRKLITP